MSAAYAELDDLDLVWGGEAIAKELKRNKRVAYYLLETGAIPAKKAGKQWVISRRKLHEAFDLVGNTRTREIVHTE